MAKTVEIKIVGEVNSGKTTLATLIEQALREVGLSEVHVFDANGDSSPNTFSLMRRVSALRDADLNVVIRTEQVTKTMRSKSGK